MPAPPVFDTKADAYDWWYEASAGRLLFEEEVDCLRCLNIDYTGRWLEIGVGTGRFAEAFGITHGIDLSLPMATKAARRGVRVCVGRAEELPFPEHVYDGVLMALTFCFLENPEKTLRECAGILRENGKLVLGTVPADSPWGRAYIRKGDEGHPVYAHAHFFTIVEIMSLFEEIGFTFRHGCSSLCWGPDRWPTVPSKTAPGIIAEAGFVGLLFENSRFNHRANRFR